MVEINLPDCLLSRYHNGAGAIQNPYAPIVLHDDVNLWMAQHGIRGWLGVSLSRTRFVHDDGYRHSHISCRYWIEFEDEQQAMLFKLTWL